jgi:hypothetical protein
VCVGAGLVGVALAVGVGDRVGRLVGDGREVTLTTGETPGAAGVDVAVAVSAGSAIEVDVNTNVPATSEESASPVPLSVPPLTGEGGRRRTTADEDSGINPICNAANASSVTTNVTTRTTSCARGCLVSIESPRLPGIDGEYTLPGR